MSDDTSEPPPSGRATHTEFHTEPPEGDTPDRNATTVRCTSLEEVEQTLKVHPSQHTAPQAPGQGARFQDLRHIARGGMSVVTEVFDRLIMRRIAVKELSKPEDLSEVTRMLEEAQITGQLDHPNIVPVYDIQADERGLPTRFSMKMVEGMTLRERITSHPPDAVRGSVLEDLLGVFLKVCDALSFAHDRGVLHRDLKPQNVMVGSHGQVYLMDWGVALLTHNRPGRSTQPFQQIRTGAQTMEESGTLTGTPSYMAPEQALGLTSTQDERTDIYGLGGILYFMLTRRPPHDASSVTASLQLAAEGRVPPAVAPADNAELPPGLLRIAMKALSADPDERYQNVYDMKHDVEGFLRGGGWFESRRVQKGTMIVREGDVAYEAFIITEGHCRLFRTVDGEEHFIRLLGAGDVFGETSIFTSSPRNASVEATGEVSMVVVTRAALERELDRSSWMRAFVEAVAERFQEHDQKLRRLEAADKG